MNQLKERFRCIKMLARICGIMYMKRETFSLAVYYLDQYVSIFSYPCMKIVAFGALTLALKIDDAEMLSKFCYKYMQN